jgi:hypothetical protein
MPHHTDVIVFDDGAIRTMFSPPIRIVFDEAGDKIAEVRITGVRLPDGGLDGENPPYAEVFISRDDTLNASQLRGLARALDCEC